MVLRFWCLVWPKALSGKRAFATVATTSTLEQLTRLGVVMPHHNHSMMSWVLLKEMDEKDELDPHLKVHFLSRDSTSLFGVFVSVLAAFHLELTHLDPIAI
jgi:hypothetical protein